MKSRTCCFLIQAPISLTRRFLAGHDCIFLTTHTIFLIFTKHNVWLLLKWDTHQHLLEFSLSSWLIPIMISTTSSTSIFSLFLCCLGVGMVYSGSSSSSSVSLTAGVGPFYQHNTWHVKPSLFYWISQLCILQVFTHTAGTICKFSLVKVPQNL